MFLKRASDVNKNEVNHDGYEVGSGHGAHDGVC